MNNTLQEDLNQEPVYDAYVKQALIDIDNQIAIYVKENICKDISDNGVAYNVNLKFSNPQRISSQMNRGDEMDYTDSKAELPLIVINRIAVDTQEGIIPTWMPDSVFSYIAKKEYKKQNNMYPDVEYSFTRVPTNVTINYDIRIITNTKKHNDILIERFVMNNGRNWSKGKYAIYLKYTSITDSSNPINNDTERIIKSNFSASAYTKLSPATKNEDLIKKVSSLKAVSIQDEEEMTMDEFIKRYY